MRFEKRLIKKLWLPKTLINLLRLLNYSNSESKPVRYCHLNPSFYRETVSLLLTCIWAAICNCLDDNILIQFLDSSTLNSSEEMFNHFTTMDTLLTNFNPFNFVYFKGNLCSDGSKPYNCPAAPCDTARCFNYPDAQCR